MDEFKKFLKGLADDASKEINSFLDKLEKESNPPPPPVNNSNVWDSYSNQPKNEADKGRYESDKTCGSCGQRSVYFMGTDFHGGNPMTGASDCDVSHHYRCDSCHHTWEHYC